MKLYIGPNFRPLTMAELEPTLQEAFPYIRWCPVRDARTPRLHALLERIGLNGTAFFHRNDPFLSEWFELRRWWERRGRAPCRCGWIDCAVETAAAAKVAEATEWLATGIEPKHVWVAKPPFDPWDKKLIARCRKS